MNKKKLLNISSRYYLISSIIVLVLLLPVFYVVVDKLYLIDIEDTLLMRRDEFLKFHAPSFTENDIIFWNKFNRDVKIIDGQKVKQDSIVHTHFYDELSDENEPYLALYAPINIAGKPYTYFTRIDMVEAVDLVVTLSMLFSLMAIMFIAALFFINRWLLQKIWHSFYDILSKIESFELGKTTIPELAKSNVIEFSKLSGVVEKLIKRNIIIYRNQKEFIENASHELQTPLAVLRSKINLLLQSKNITYEQSEILATIELSLARITRINKNLLLIAKIENNQFFETKTIELTAIVDETVKLLTDYAATKKITVDKILTGKLAVACNKTLIEILINNLLVNAIVHNTKKGHIQIELSGRTLVVSNTGGTKLNDEKLFQRFAVSSSETANIGLGLAIVKEICNRYQWTVAYTFQNNLHSFSVKF